MPPITVWTTIFCQENPGRGAYAFQVERRGLRPLRAAFGRRRTTTNRMQLMGVIAALTQLNRRHPGEQLDITLHSPSRYVTDGIHKAWHKGQKEGKPNADLWQRLEEQLGDHRVDAEWARTGSTPQLAKLQEMAQEACRQENLPPDTGYEKMEAAEAGRREAPTPTPEMED